MVANKNYLTNRIDDVRVKINFFDFNNKPIIVFIELTKACEYKCIHCRAESMLKPLPNELKTNEVKKILDDLSTIEKPYPLIVFTGGNPVIRDDLFEILDYAKTFNFPTALAPAITSKIVNEDFVKELKNYNLRLSISLDGFYEKTHNYIRVSVLGENSFNLTLEFIKPLVVIINSPLVFNHLPSLIENSCLPT